MREAAGAFGSAPGGVDTGMSATRHNIIVWGTEPGEGPRTVRHPQGLQYGPPDGRLRKRYSEVTGLAARLIDECRRLRAENDDLRASAEIWIRWYERQLARANRLEQLLERSRHD